MKMYVPFGDWSDDGHGKSIKILINAPSMGCLLEAQDKIRDFWGNSFFDGFADKYEEPYFSETVWEALEFTHYPIERVIEKLDDVRYEKYESISEMIENNSEVCVTLDLVIDAFFWLLNHYGAHIEREEDYPTICNWTCNGFETVGYGCYEFD